MKPFTTRHMNNSKLSELPPIPETPLLQPPPLPQLPPIPHRPPRSFVRCVVLSTSCIFLYCTVLSDNGLLVALLPKMTTNADYETWVRSVKLPIFIWSLVAVVAVEILLLLFKKRTCVDLVLTCVCCFYFFIQILWLNISPLS